MRMTRKLFLLLAFTASACSGAADRDADAATDTLTRAQRDSVIGASALPGARSVQRANDTRDTANARATAMDSLLRQ